MESRRFFVTVVAPDRSRLQRLRSYDLDLFRETAKVAEKTESVLGAVRETAARETYQPTGKTSQRQEFSIDGLLSLEEIDRLVEDGYQVLVKERDLKRSRAVTEGIEFQSWLQGMEE